MIESLHLQFPCFKSQVNAKAAENAKGRKNPQHDRKGFKWSANRVITGNRGPDIV